MTLGGSLALLAARCQPDALAKWLQLARIQQEDIDLDVYASLPYAKIKSLLSSVWSGVDVQQSATDQRSFQVTNPDRLYRFHLCFNPNRKPYPDAISWYWCVNENDWILDRARLLPSQQEFLTTQLFVPLQDNRTMYLNYSLYWSLVQLVKHRFYGFSEGVCAVRLQWRLQTKSDRAEIAQCVLDVMHRFEKTAFWQSAVQIVLQHTICLDARGQAVTPFSYLLPERGHRCMHLAAESISSMASLRKRVCDLYRNDNDLPNLLAHQGVFAWDAGMHQVEDDGAQSKSEHFLLGQQHASSTHTR